MTALYPRIGALIPIRLASERLPGKALMPICGRPVVYHLLDRICATRNIISPKDVVVCTTEEASDDPLEDAVLSYGCSIFRGATDDIIRRFRDAMIAYAFDVVMQPDGDDPLSSYEYLDLTIDYLRANPEVDYVTSVGLPLGVNVKSFTRKGIDKVFSGYRSERNDTGFASLFSQTGLCNAAEINALGTAHKHDDSRLTLDYQEDLDVFRAIIGALYEPGRVFDTSTLVCFLNENPQILEINKGVEKVYWERWQQKRAGILYVDKDGIERELN